MEKQTLPNSTLILIFGILSLLGCCCTGFLGIIFGAIGIYMANKATTVYNENPQLYEGYNNVKTGKILCIIGLILSIITTIYSVFMISTMGVAGYQEMIEGIMEGM